MLAGLGFLQIIDAAAAPHSADRACVLVANSHDAGRGWGSWDWDTPAGAHDAGRLESWEVDAPADAPYSGQAEKKIRRFRYSGNS